MNTPVVILFSLFLACNCLAEDTDSIFDRFEVEYSKRYREAVNSGRLDLKDEDIPKDIRANQRFSSYYRAGYIRGLLTRLNISGYKSGEGLGNYYRSMKDGVFYYEGLGWEAGCRKANEAATKIHSKLLTDLKARLKEVDPATP
ncbi:hypothetical protein HW115_19005 [Verrucomicrobiaceae bacterium N1E253]|uniref:Uncharacterized protein n=1 Tax=Oceaniferula marina TaxID=2748318 RepID=A0A851GRG6_9BACT|nr:hypothetical protein [Oceaniferula marina]NWK57715.1 hypothetical protein [Oceaniferula marina]